ncbi:hypothetical protein GCM10009677_19660 [Sphaerisporangium rubeum]|uniref:Uncharacterized protein n=1 Tax=Sphaerisporangium rubeum TaxID=321317 RepID=A0A7X0MB55_9ACTN|nr:hypothetical protein [Sphaerisporangium rubeum]MBB6476736.1 hypothetical protein [Sphaerisporangium rubeum]
MTGTTIRHHLGIAAVLLALAGGWAASSPAGAETTTVTAMIQLDGPPWGVAGEQEPAGPPWGVADPEQPSGPPWG